MEKKGEFKMKKVSLLVLVSMILLLAFSSCTLLFGSVAGNEHVHEFSEEWSYNSSKHFHACDCGGKEDLALHVDEKENDGKCDVCGYQMSEPVVTPVYTVTVGAVANATVSASTYEVKEGEDVVITVTVDEGYSLTATGATIDGEPTSKDGKLVYTLKVSDVKSDVTVTLTTRVIVPVCEHNWQDATCTAAKVCTLCGETDGEALGHNWQAATCTAPNTCTRCGESYGSVIPHVEGTAATCTSPAICANCDKPFGEALGHNWQNPTCDTPKTCKTCGATEGEALGHDWADADCDTPKTCKTCGATDGEALGHDWEAPTCTMPGYCKVCGTPGDKATGHSYSDATCTEPKTCSLCGNKSGNALGHKWVDPTCTENGYCSVCNEPGEAATGHSHVVVSTTPASCTENGSKVYECACGDTYTETLVAPGHTEGPEATCTENQVCTVCGAVLAEATGHNYETNTVAPTCDRPGYTLYVCDCGDSYTADPVPALGHTPGAEADCENSQICTVCEEVLVEALGHKHEAVVTKPTCEEAGYTTYTCYCGDTYTADHVDAIGHNYEETVVAPSCSDTGHTLHLCSYCGDSYRTNETPALGHTPGAAADCENAQICTVCEEVLVEALGHTDGAAATCDTAQTCTVCGDVIVPALGHAWSDWADLGDGTHSRVCGNDASHVEAGAHDWTEATYYEPAKCTVCGLVGDALYHELIIGQNAEFTVNGGKEVYARFVASEPGTYKIFAWQYVTAIVDGVEIGNDGFVEFELTEDNLTKIFKIGTTLASPAKASICLEIVRIEVEDPDQGGGVSGTSGTITGIGDDVEGKFVQKVTLPEDGIYLFTPTEYSTEAAGGLAPILMISRDGVDFSIFDGVLEDVAGDYYIGVLFVSGEEVTVSYAKYDFVNAPAESTIDSEGNGSFTITVTTDGTYVFRLTGYPTSDDAPFAPIITYNGEIVTGDIYLTAGEHTFTLTSMIPDGSCIIVWYQQPDNSGSGEGEEEVVPSTSGTITGIGDDVEGKFVQKVTLPEDGIYLFTPTEYSTEAAGGLAPILMISRDGVDFSIFDGVLEDVAGDYYIGVLFVSGEEVTVSYAKYDFVNAPAESTIDSEGNGSFTITVTTDGTYVFRLTGYPTSDDAPFAPIITYNGEIVTGDIYLTAGEHTFTLTSMIPDGSCIIAWYQQPDNSGSGEGSEEGGEEEHTHSHVASVTEPTCTEAGYTTHTCECGDSYTDTPVDALGHTEGAAATCTEDQVCTVCGAVLAEATGHSYAATVTKPTCTEAGYTTYTCACGDSYISDNVDALGHTAGAEATCTENQVCTVCGAVLAEATGHNHVASVTEPTCTEAGYTTHTCACGDSYTDTPVDAPGHTEGAAATCTEDQVCTVCGAVLAEATGHSYENGYCSCGAIDPDYYFEMTIAEALAAADNTKVIVSGTVCAINTAWSDSYGNISVTITDADGNTLYLYRLETNVALGDIITAKGTMATYNSNRQMAQGGTAEITGHDSGYDYAEMTIEEALAAADNTNVIVTGTVVKINTAYSDSYGNISVTIADENGNQLYLYRLTGNVALNDVIKVKGAMATYSGSRQVEGGTFEKVGTHTCSTYTDATCGAAAACVVCGATTGEPTGLHTYADATCTAPKTCTECGATEGEPADHTYVDGVCSGCGKEEGAAEKTATSVSKTHTEIATIAGVTAGQSTGVIAGTTIALNDDISIVCAKGGSTSDPCIYSESIRLYQKGATLTVKAADGCEMTTIVITLANKSGGQGPITVTGGTASALSNYTYTITVDAGVSEVVITTAGTTSSTRLYVAGIEVNYNK